MLAVLTILLVVFLCSIGLFWWIGGPRLLSEELLSASLQQPLSLAANPRIYWGRQQLQIDLYGLRIGTQAKPQLQVRRLMLGLDWRLLLQGRLQLQQLFVDQPVWYGPAPNSSSHSVAFSTVGPTLILPGNTRVRDGTVHWENLAGHPLTITAIYGQVLASGPTRLSGLWEWGAQRGTWHLGAVIHKRAALSVQQFRLQVGSKPLPEAFTLNIPALEYRQNHVDLPLLRLYWQESPQRPLRGSVEKIRVDLARSQLRVGNVVLNVGENLALTLHTAEFSWSKRKGEFAYRLMVQHLPQLARRWGVVLPQLQDPDVPRLLSATGSIAMNKNQFTWIITHGMLDSSPWSGQISGTWKPLAIRLSLQMQRLDLNHYLPAPTPGPAPILPSLPALWPVTGSLRLGQLVWGQIRAQQVVIRSNNSPNKIPEQP